MDFEMAGTYSSILNLFGGRNANAEKVFAAWINGNTFILIMEMFLTLIFQ